MWVRERGEDTNNNDDDDNGGDDEMKEEEEMVADDIEWDNLENEDVLIGVGSSLQASGPFPFHGGEGISGEPAEAGHTIGLPQDSTEASGSTIAPKVPAEVGGSTVMP